MFCLLLLSTSHRTAWRCIRSQTLGSSCHANVLYYVSFSLERRKLILLFSRYLNSALVEIQLQVESLCYSAMTRVQEFPPGLVAPALSIIQFNQLPIDDLVGKVIKLLSKKYFPGEHVSVKKKSVE